MSITKNQKSQVKEIIGRNYSLKFKAYLEKKGVENGNNKAYSLAHIRWYFSTDTSGTSPLDEHLLEFWDIQAKKQAARAKRMKALHTKTESLLNN